MDVSNTALPDVNLGPLCSHEIDYIMGEEDMRSDVYEILMKDSHSFRNWYNRRMEVVEEEIAKYEDICDIPNLDHEESGFDMHGHRSLGGQLESLRDAKAHLEELKETWEEVHDDTFEEDYMGVEEAIEMGIL